MCYGHFNIGDCCFHGEEYWSADTAPGIQTRFAVIRSWPLKTTYRYDIDILPLSHEFGPFDIFEEKLYIVTRQRSNHNIWNMNCYDLIKRELVWKTQPAVQFFPPSRVKAGHFGAYVYDQTIQAPWFQPSHISLYNPEGDEVLTMGDVRWGEYFSLVSPDTGGLFTSRVMSNLSYDGRMALATNTKAAEDRNYEIRIFMGPITFTKFGNSYKPSIPNVETIDSGLLETGSIALHGGAIYYDSIKNNDIFYWHENIGYPALGDPNTALSWYKVSIPGLQRSVSAQHTPEVDFSIFFSSVAYSGAWLGLYSTSKFVDNSSFNWNDLKLVYINNGHNDEVSDSLEDWTLTTTEERYKKYSPLLTPGTLFPTPNTGPNFYANNLINQRGIIGQAYLSSFFSSPKGFPDLPDDMTNARFSHDGETCEGWLGSTPGITYRIAHLADDFSLPPIREGRVFDVE